MTILERLWDIYNGGESEISADDTIILIEVVEALENLKTWGDWIKKYRRFAPLMNEPNTGALMKAAAVLAKLEAPADV